MNFQTEKRDPMLLFFIIVLAMEYVGIKNYAPVLKSLSLELVLSTIMLIYIIIKYNLREIIKCSQFKLLAFWVFFTGISIFYALVTIHAFNALKAQMGYFILFIVGSFLLQDIKKINATLAAMLIFHVFLVLVNIEQLFTETRSSYPKAGYFLGDGNDFGWSLVIILPYSVYFLSISKTLAKRTLALLPFTTTVSGIVGTGSRGAFIASIAAMFYLCLVTKRRALILMATLIIFAIVLTLSPDNYVRRMRSIVEYQRDSSAKQRIVAWKAAFQMTLDYPLGVGAGNFNSVYGRFYVDEFHDPSVWANRRWVSTHSIYFKAMAEYGFLGLLILVALLVSNIMMNLRSMFYLKAKKVRVGNSAILPICLNTSIVAYGVGGLFLGGIHYPHLYLLSSLTVALYAVCSGHAGNSTDVEVSKEKALGPAVQFLSIK